MTPKTVAILLIFTVVSAAAAGFGIAERVNFQETDFEGQRVFPDLLDNAKSVDKIKVTQSGRVMTFVKHDSGWTLAESGNYPVHDNLVSKVVFALANLELLDQKTALPSRHASLQLGNPGDKDAKSQRVELYNADGKTMADIVVGSANYFLPETTTGGIYIRRPDEDQTWLARGLVDIGVERRDWLVRDIVDIPPERIAKVVVDHPDGERQIVVPAPSATGEFKFENMPEGRKLKSEYAPSNIASVLKDLILNDVRTADSIDLDPAAAYKATFTGTDGIQVETRMWGQDGTQYLTVSAGGEGLEPGSDAQKQAAAIAERTAGWIYIIPEYQYEQISKKFERVTEKVEPES